jgi:sucrose-6-phosphate hydrolase SacC (GH32 family)
VFNTIDRPYIYAGKRMFDGKRHIWTGWFVGGGPLNGNKPWGWGGTQCLPRELYAGPDGQLYCKPVNEVTAVFKKTVLSREQFKVDAASTFDVPDNYMVECQVQLDLKAELVIAMRQQPDSGDAYRFTLSPEKSEAQFSVPDFSFNRPCPVDTTKPIKFQAFVQGKFIECFINDQYATSCRAFSFYKGKLAFEVKGGDAKVLSLAVKTDDGVLFENPDPKERKKMDVAK